MTDHQHKKPNEGSDVSGFIILLVLAAFFGSIILWLFGMLTHKS